MGCYSSKTLTRKNFIKLVEKKTAARFIFQEHRDIISEETRGTFGASIATGYFEGYEYENGGLYFDHSRVVLPREKGSRKNINASYIDGFECQEAYIATRIPHSVTAICDFWKVIWEHQTEIIVMLNTPDVKENGISYWHPEEGGLFQCEKLSITTSNLYLDHPNFEITKLIVTHEDGGSLLVNHFFYNKWQHDDILPLECDFLDFMFIIRTYNQLAVTPEYIKGYKSPIVVHCSDGLERSMAFCAIDISISQILKTGRVNLFSIVSQLRRNRFDCLKDVDHYHFCYLVLYFYLTFYM